jgi:RNA polymerase sigma-70 factor, ECF subfamily
MGGPGDDPLPAPASLAAGEERAFAALYDRFGQRLYRAAIGMLGRREDAEDIVQEVFVAVLQTWPRLSGGQDLTAYLFTALRRAAARCAVRRAWASTLCEMAADELAASAVPADDRSGPYSDRLQRALLALPVEQREVIALKIDGELTFAEIAQVIGVSINTAASRYRYALEKLRVSLGKNC